MKLLFSLSIILLSGIISISQDLLTNISAYEAGELSQKGTSYNDFLNKTVVAPDGKKFVVIEGLVNEDANSEIEVDDKELIFEADSKVYQPIGYIDRGEISFKSPRDLNLKYASGFGYIYSVDKAVSKGELKLGAIPTVVISSIDKSVRDIPKPKMMEVVSNSVLDKFEAKDEFEAEKDVDSDFKIVYTPYSGKFLKVEINVLAPDNPTAGNNDNYNFHPDHFFLTAADGTIYKCAAFIRDGNYDDPFSESMNSNVRYSETEPTKLTLVFYFGTSKGDFTLFHKGVDSGTINVK